MTVATSTPLTELQRQMVEDNVGLVVEFLHRHRIPADVWDDRFQDGVLGLMRAVQLFDSARGVAFSTYANHWILHGVTKGRAAAEDVNWRRANLHGIDSYEPPLSLDWIADNHDNPALLALIGTCDDRFDAVDDELCDNTDTLDERASAVAETFGLSYDDVAVLTWPVRDAADWLGINKASVSRRRARLRARLQARYADAA